MTILNYEDEGVEKNGGKWAMKVKGFAEFCPARGLFSPVWHVTLTVEDDRDWVVHYD